MVDYKINGRSFTNLDVEKIAANTADILKNFEGKLQDAMDDANVVCFIPGFFGTAAILYLSNELIKLLNSSGYSYTEISFKVVAVSSIAGGLILANKPKIKGQILYFNFLRGIQSIFTVAKPVLQHI